MLVNDYGPVRLEDVERMSFVHRFAGSMAGGIHFPFLEKFLTAAILGRSQLDYGRDDGPDRSRADSSSQRLREELIAMDGSVWVLGGREKRQAEESGRTFLGYLTSIEDWLSERGVTVSARIVEQSAELPRLGSWSEQVTLYQIEVSQIADH